MKNRVFGIFCICLFLIIDCSFAAGKNNGKLSVFVSIAPMAEAVQKIGGGHVEVTVLVPPGMNPETYSPPVKRMMLLEKADLFCAIGVPYEASLLTRLKTMVPELRVRNMRHGMKLRNIRGGAWEEQAEKTHHEEYAGEHSDSDMGHEHHEDGDSHEDDSDCNHFGHHHHPGADPHVWLDIDNMIVYSRQVAEELTDLKPECAMDFRTASENYIVELQKLKDDLKKLLEMKRGQTILSFHPAFGYYLDMFGIAQLAIEQDGKEPTGGHLTQVIHQAQELHCKNIYVQPQFNVKSATVIANEMKGKVVVLDPLPAKYTDGLRKMAKALLKE